MDISVKLGFTFFISISILSFILLYQGYSKNSYIKAQSIAAIEEKAATEKQISELEDDITFTDTDEFVEKIAREKLGFIKKNEFIFIEQKSKG